MTKISGIHAREIFDSRGIPTIECTLWLDNNAIVLSNVPSGTSRGKYEALELRDNDPNHFLGRGVLTAVNNINSVITPQLIGSDPTEQVEIDQLLVNLDGTPNKSKLGANAILAVSQAVLKAGALSANMPVYYYVQQKYQLTTQLLLPTSIFGIVNGGMHGADNLNIQEFQIIPATNMDFMESLEMSTTIFHRFGEVLESKGAVHSTGLTGGYTPNLYSNSDVFELIVETIKGTTYTFSQDLFFGIDAAASEFHQNGKYILKDKSDPYTSRQLLDYYKKLRELYHVFLIEDPYHEDDVKAWQELTAELGENTKVVGDNLLVTNKERTLKSIKEKSCNTLLIKPNQVGTISETADVVRVAKEAGWTTIMSHRSGETNDDIVADLAVGFGTEYSKFGPVQRGERVAKYNRLMQIYSEIHSSSNDNTNITSHTSVSKPVGLQETTSQTQATTTSTQAPTVHAQSDASQGETGQGEVDQGVVGRSKVSEGNINLSEVSQGEVNQSNDDTQSQLQQIDKLFAQDESNPTVQGDNPSDH